MAVSLQVIYPAAEGSKFDHGYYAETHIKLVQDQMGQHIQDIIVTRGLSGGPDTPAPYHAIATLVFADQSAMDAAMQAAGPALADIPNFTDVPPKMLIGEVFS